MNINIIQKQRETRAMKNNGSTVQGVGRPLVIRSSTDGDGRRVTTAQRSRLSIRRIISDGRAADDADNGRHQLFNGMPSVHSVPV